MIKVYILQANAKECIKYKKFFESKGFEVSAFLTLKQLDKKLSEVIPDVLVADYELPSGTSLRLLNKYKFKISLIIGMTGHFDDPKVRKSLYKAGCVDVKPTIAVNMVCNSINMLLNNKRGRDTAWL